MRLNVEKKLITGKFFLKIQVAELSLDEKLKIEKFGAPLISIAPKEVYFANKFRQELPLHAINHEFEFRSEDDANAFFERISSSMKQAIAELRLKTDQFSGAKEYDF